VPGAVGRRTAALVQAHQLLPAKKRAFVLAYVASAPRSAPAAYLAVYPRARGKPATEIVARADRLGAVTLDEVVKRSRDIAETAISEGNLGAAVQAARLLAQLGGHLTERGKAVDPGALADGDADADVAAKLLQKLNLLTMPAGAAHGDAQGDAQE
jgi:hypothetical protein